MRKSKYTAQQIAFCVTQPQAGIPISELRRKYGISILPWTHADVVELGIDDLTATSLSIALNRTSELSGWDLPTLGRLLEDLKVPGALDGVGFELPKIQERRRSRTSRPNAASSQPLRCPSRRRERVGTDQEGRPEGMGRPSHVHSLPDGNGDLHGHRGNTFKVPDATSCRRSKRAHDRAA